LHPSRHAARMRQLFRGRRIRTNLIENRSSTSKTSVSEPEHWAIRRKMPVRGGQHSATGEARPTLSRARPGLTLVLSILPTDASTRRHSTQAGSRPSHTQFSHEIFDFCAGLALRDCLAENNGQVDAGVWFTSAKTGPTQLIRLHHMAFVNAWPLTWFIIEHFALGSSRHGRRLSRIPGADSDNQVRSEHSARVKKIVIGDEGAVRDLIRELVSAGEDRDAPDSIRVLPRHTITIKVTAGKSLPPDLARVRFD
jgi:hypothetical protein